ncbi:MAG: GNAT family N-acetyltransferase [Candidatus Symbiothrix sp.]|jgi:GNAT superfamily N-acetyltransferase|nr:GNAT family N-acetyltransferase [Candidatus Symbiothrix sp.]
MKIEYKELTLQSDNIQVLSIFNIDISKIINYANGFGAFIGNNMIGILLLSKSADGYIHIIYFNVLPLFRCKGIGSALLRLAEKYSASISSTKIIVKYNSLNHSLDRCNNFFVNNGFIQAKYTYTTIKLKRSKFLNNIVPEKFNSQIRDHLKNIEIKWGSSLDGRTLSIIDCQSKKIISGGLLPLNSIENMFKDLSVFVFDDENLIAWSVVDLRGHNEVSIRATFIVEKYRKYRLGLFLWNSIFCRAKENSVHDFIRWISFDFDKEDVRNNRLYSLLFDKVSDFKADYYINEKILL